MKAWWKWKRDSRDRAKFYKGYNESGPSINLAGEGGSAGTGVSVGFIRGVDEE